MNFNIARAWKDEVYASNLSNEERAMLPECPVGAIDLGGDEMDMVVGAVSTLCSNGAMGCTFSTGASSCHSSFGATACNSTTGAGTCDVTTTSATAVCLSHVCG